MFSIAETRNEENFEDGDVPLIRPSCDRKTQAHLTVTENNTTKHNMVTGHNDPNNGIPDYLTGRIRTQKNPLPQRVTQPQNILTNFSRQHLANG